MTTISAQDTPAPLTGPDTPVRQRGESVADKENTSDTTNKPVQQADKENETVTVKNGCYYPWKTGLENDTAMQGLVNDAMKVWDTDPKDPNFPCGEVENGGAVTIYTKYEWESNKKHPPVERALKEAGRRWGKERPTDQQEFIKKCVRALQEKMNLTKEETEILLLMSAPGTKKQTQHMDSGFYPNKFTKGDIRMHNADTWVQNTLDGNGRGDANRRQHVHSHSMDYP